MRSDSKNRRLKFSSVSPFNIKFDLEIDQVPFGKITLVNFILPFVILVFSPVFVRTPIILLLIKSIDSGL